MSNHDHHHRSRKGDVVARVVVLAGLAAALGMMAYGGRRDAEPQMLMGACPASAPGLFTSL
jgi:hypothetical protein